MKLAYLEKQLEKPILTMVYAPDDWECRDEALGDAIELIEFWYSNGWIHTPTYRRLRRRIEQAYYHRRVR